MSNYSLKWILLLIFGYHCVIGQSISNSEISTSRSHEFLSSMSNTIMVQSSYVSSQSLYTSFAPTFVNDLQTSKEIVMSDFVSSESLNSIQSSHELSSFSKDRRVTSSSPDEAQTTFQQETGSPSASTFHTMSFLVVSSENMPQKDSDGVGGFTLLQSGDMLTGTAPFYTETNGENEKSSVSQRANLVTSNVMSETHSLFDSSVTSESTIRSQYDTRLSILFSSLVPSPTVYTSDYSIAPSPTKIDEGVASKMTSSFMYSSFLTTSYSSDLLNMTNPAFDTVSTAHAVEGVSSLTTQVETHEHSINVLTSSMFTLSFYSDLTKGSIDQSVISSYYSQQSETSPYITTEETASHMNEEIYEFTSSVYTEHSLGTRISLSNTVFRENSVLLASSFFLSVIESSYVSESSIYEVMPVSESSLHTGIEITSIQNIESTSAIFSTGLGLHSLGSVQSSNYLQTETESSSINYRGSSNSDVFFSAFTTLDTFTKSSNELETFTPRVDETDMFMGGSSTVARDSFSLNFDLSSTYIPLSTLVPLSTSDLRTINIETVSMTGITSNFDITPVSSNSNETSFDSVYPSVSLSQSQGFINSVSEYLSVDDISSSVIDSDTRDINVFSSSWVHSTLETPPLGLTKTTFFKSFEVSETSAASLTSDVAEQIKTSSQSVFNTLTILLTNLISESVPSTDNSLFESIVLTLSPMPTLSILDTTFMNKSESGTKSLLSSYSAIINPTYTTISKSQDQSETFVLSSDLIETKGYFSSNSGVILNSPSIFDLVSSEIDTDLQTFVTTTVLSEEIPSEFETEKSIIDTASLMFSKGGSDISSTAESIGITEDSLSSLILQSTVAPTKPVISSTMLPIPVPLTTTKLDIVSVSTLLFKTLSSEAVYQTYVSLSPDLRSSYVENISQIFTFPMEGHSEISKYSDVLESSSFQILLSSNPESFDITSKMTSSFSEVSNEYSAFSQISDLTPSESTDSSIMSTADTSEVILETLQTKISSLSIESSTLILTTQIFPSNIISTDHRSLRTSYNTHTLSEQLPSLSSYNEISSTIPSISQTVDVSSIESFDISTNLPITAANSSDFLLPSLTSISSFSSTPPTIQLVTETVDSRSIFTSSTTANRSDFTPTRTDSTPTKVDNTSAGTVTIPTSIDATSTGMVTTLTSIYSAPASMVTTLTSADTTLTSMVTTLTSADTTPTSMVTTLTSADITPTSTVTTLIGTDTTPTSTLTTLTGTDTTQTSMLTSLISVDPTPTSMVTSLTSLDPTPTSMVTSHTSVDPSQTSMFTTLTGVDPTPTSMVTTLNGTDIAPTSTDTTPTSIGTTPQTPELKTNNITNADESYWIKTVLTIRKTTDISSESFRSDIEERMAVAYSEAFKRERLMQQGLFENLRRKRYSSNGETSVHIHDVSRVGDSTSVNVVYAVEKSGTRLSPTDAVTSLNVLSTQELAIILRQVVQTVAEPYQSVSKPDDVTDSDGIPLWLVAAITGSVGGFIILVWLFVCVYIKCCREKKETEKHVEPELTSIQQNDTTRGISKRHTDANGAGTSSRNSLPNQTSKSSLTKKSTAYQIKPSDEEALIEKMTEPEVEEHVFENKLVTQTSSPPTKHHSPRIKPPEKPVGTVSTTSLTHKQDIESTTHTKKTKRASKLSGIDGSIPGMDYPDNTDKPRLLKYQLIQSSFSDQDNDDLRDRTLLERQKNKDRARHKRRKPRQKDEVHPTSVLYSTMGIPSTPLPSVQVESGSPVRDNTIRNITKTLDGGLSTENLSGDESLQEARTRMHRLLDDAFSLISPRASYTQNNFPRENNSQPYINKEDGLTVGTRSVERIDRETDKDIKHEPMYVNPFYSESSFPLETWSPYRTSDLVAMISMPSKQEPTKLGQKPKSATRPMSSKPNRRPAASFDFSETKSATTFDEDRFTTSPAKPIVIRTKSVTEDGSTSSNKPSSNRVPSGRTTVMVSPLPKSNQNEQFEMNSLSKGTSRNGSAGKYKSRSIDRSNMDEVDVINDLDAEQSSDKLLKSLRDELGELKELYSVPNTRIERKKHKKNAHSSHTELV